MVNVVFIVMMVNVISLRVKLLTAKKFKIGNFQ